MARAAVPRGAAWTYGRGARPPGARGHACGARPTHATLPPRVAAPVPSYGGGACFHPPDLTKYAKDTLRGTMNTLTSLDDL